MFAINVRVEFEGRFCTAVGFDHTTKRYQLRETDDSLTFAAESALKVVA